MLAPAPEEDWLCRAISSSRVFRAPIGTWATGTTGWQCPDLSQHGTITIAIALRLTSPIIGDGVSSRH